VKDINAAQGVAEGVVQDVTKGVLGAAEDGGVKVLILLIAIFQRRNPRYDLGTPCELWVFVRSLLSYLIEVQQRE